MQPLDDRHQLTITERASGRLAAFRRPVTRRSHKPALELLTQYAADPLNPETILMLIDVADHRGAGRSSSAAKNADAVRRISFARRSSAFSFFNRRISASSSEVVPGRVPASTSERRSHLRSVSLFTPSRDATAWIAAPSVSYCSCCRASPNSRNARCRNSAGNCFGMVHPPIEDFTKPRTVHGSHGENGGSDEAVGCGAGRGGVAWGGRLRRRFPTLVPDQQGAPQHRLSA